MSSLRACRACLRSTGPLFPLDGVLLRHFHRLMELQTLAEEESYGVACAMCRSCLGALRGAVRLRASALRARSLLLPGGGLPFSPPEHAWPGLGRSGPVLLNSRDREVVLPGPNIGLFILFESDESYDEKMDPDGPDGSYEPDEPEGTLGLDQPPKLHQLRGPLQSPGLENTLDGTADVKFEIKEEHVTSLVKKEEFDSLDDLPLADLPLDDLPLDDLPLDDLPLDDLPLALEAAQWDQKRKHRKNKVRRRKTEGKTKTEGKLKTEGCGNKKTERRHKVKGKSRTSDKGRKESKKKGSSRMVLETDEYTVIKLDMAEVEAARQATLVSPRFLSAPHRCEACAKAFNYPDVLAAHALRHRPAPLALECPLCHQFLPSAVSLRGHLKSHTTKYKCKQCGFIKASRQDLLEHFALQHTSCPRTYVCNVCNKTLTKRTMFQKHMRVHFPSSKVTCDKCGKLFKTIETLRAHMLRHADVARYPCSQCPKAFRYASLLYSHKVTHLTSQDFYCVECDLRFKTASNLRLHLRKTKAHADSSKMEFACDQCPRRYAAEKQLKAHVAWVHLGLREYECPLCQKQFGTRDGLRSHQRKIHDGIRPERSHICHFCNKAFRAKAVLVKHLRVHTGERPFSCPDCGKKFAQDSTLNTHVRLVHLKLQRTKHSP